MKNISTELVFILDRSGSMSGLESDTIGGFNAMIEKQKKLDGECFVTTILFDNFSETLHDRVSIQDIEPMTDSDYSVRGCTALIDALGGAIEHIEKIHKYIRKDDVPQNTLFVITTDGQENASKNFSSKQVKKMVEKKKECGWEFIFIGANIDAVETAGRYGISADRAANYHADEKGTKVVYEAVSCAVESMRRNDIDNFGTFAFTIEKDYNNRKKNKK